MTQNNEIRWVYLGDFIEQREERNADNALGPNDVRGLSTAKQLIDTKANLEGVSMTSYKLMYPMDFAYVADTSRRGDKMSLGFNQTNNKYLVSSISIVFRVKSEDLLPDFLYLWFCQPEFDRYARFHSWGSAREAFSYDDMCRVRIPLPSPEKQRELVATWKGLRDMKEQNEAMAAPLMQLCQSRLQELKHTYPLTEIGPYIELCDETNAESIQYKMLGINKDKVFMPTAANVSTVDIKKYKVVYSGRFVFSGMQTGRDVCIRISLYDDEEPCLVSPAYTTFTIKEGMSLLPEYFFLYFKRTEMDRLGWFVSDSSVRSNLDWNRFLEIQIPIPSKDEQQAIVNIYKCAAECKRIADEADRLSREICPALMQKAIRG